LADSTLILTQEKQEFVFKDIDEKPILSYLREFSAPIILETDQTDEDLLFLMANDTDGFNRWESGQKLMMRYLNNSSLSTDDFISALKQSIQSLNDDNKALLVRMLTLPKDSIIANAQNIIDPFAIAKAKDGLTEAIANGLRDDLDMLYGLCAPSGDFKTDPESMAKRALRNLVLKYKLAIDEGAAVQMAFDQYSNAVTMTEKLGALSILVETDRPQREHALAEFYEDYADHALVIDKWFSVQAACRRHDTPARVKTLMDHPAFTLSNPNRIRALIGAFAMRNQKGFHVKSGEGYKILTDIILELNVKNPQIASRLLTPMRQWKSFTADRQKLMKTELKRILESDNLSPDVYEIVSKCLS
jgi:aminopeptidase N